ncbi:glycosyltransferase family 1 protein [Cellulomonas sp. P24]|uniref:glycosyltransferase family 4 protein n=1 Tax=Cellulomonas sp. P24 TaxID=2885206 RepID=UPI00216AC0CD|nr:glycosyltransferase family 1 protein [Cellulomonas sp. P24]MCR6493779.1 glycosyltransferase family 4 protein [Cellulomonas sp. P24]
MPRLTIATNAVPVPMGQQVYEEEVASRAPAELGPTWQVRRSVVRTLRSPLAGTVRVPSYVLANASARTRRAVGALLYPRADVVHRMGLSLPPAPGPEVLTIHDTVAWRFPDETRPEPHAAAEARRAAAVVCPSAFAAHDVAERLGIPLPHAISNGVDPRFARAEPLGPDVLASLGVSGRYVLHAGGSSLRKNLEGLAGAWQLVQGALPDVTLVLVGPPSARRDALFGPLARALPIGRVSSSILPGLVAGAEAVVVPSLYEGFGLPALEAMAAGVPVVAADRSALPEVCGDAGILVEPDPDGIADGLVWAISGDPTIEAMVARGRLRAADFTWERSAAAHAAIWRSLVS